ncbi:hypothetical protein NKH77_07745 [Streptomyces sp. M19]
MSAYGGTVDTLTYTVTNGRPRPSTAAPPSGCSSTAWRCGSGWRAAAGWT